MMLDSELDKPNSIPYFLWDQPMTVAEVRNVLREGDDVEKYRMLGKILREARDRDVWKFITPSEVIANWDQVSPYLGRRRQFWEFLFGIWKREGLIG